MVHPKTLEWTQLPLPAVVKGDEGIGGLLELEELDDVRVVREQGKGGSMLSFEVFHW